MRKFIERWQNRGDEKSDTQKFWLELLIEVCGAENPGELIEFEKRVTLEHKSFIDAYIPDTRVLIEQKSRDIDLNLPALQSDGPSLTPFEQAKRYADWLPDSEHPRWIVTCNFQEFHVHNMETPKAPPEIIKLDELIRKKQSLAFLVNPNRGCTHEEEISRQAGELVRSLKKVLLERYAPNARESLSVFCVRIVFLLFAEDVGLLGKSQFHDYLKARRNSARISLIELFRVLNQSPAERSPYIEDELKNFPHINGGLFSDDDIEIPNLDGEPLRIILENMSEGFDWSRISPPIFGAIFEDTLRDDLRGEQGMHYTSIENIHKVIDPLFMDELNAKFESVKSNPAKLKRFRKKLTTLKFFDPACGSGNFLTETYLSLCRLEIKIVNALAELPLLSVSIEQFFGIEIEPFAVAVAKTALWIANIQMSKEINPAAKLERECLPLKKFDHNIIKANALTYDWAKLVQPQGDLFIMGNPPFVGHQWRSKQQNEDMKTAFHDLKDHGKLDYVCSWYNKAADFIEGTKVKAAFVSTNSICQGESVSILWKFLRDKGVSIFLAYKPFIWTSESRDKAHVHCVIIGFTRGYEVSPKFIYSSEKATQASHINGYLLDAPDVFIENRGKPKNSNMPIMKKGSQPTDDGNLILSPDERDELIAKYPEAGKFIKRYMGAREFIHNETRYCLWLYRVDPVEYRHIAPIMKRLKRVAEFRRTSPTKSVREAAETPSLFTQIRQPEGNFLVVPRVTGERKYIPIGFMTPDIITSDQVQYIPTSNLYMFGVLSSLIHMAWTRVVAGRLGLSYRYSPSVYNNFPWPGKTSGQIVQKFMKRIEATAQKILDARALYPDSSLADLYDPLTMPAELLKAHRENDNAVCDAYGWSKNLSEEEIVAQLMDLYVKLS